MRSPSAERYLSAKWLNKSFLERLCDVDAMLDAITDYAVIQLDVDGNVVRWCPGAEALIGYSAAEVLDQPVSMIYTEEDRAAGLIDRELAAARELGRCEFEGWRMHKRGRRFRANVVLAPIHDETGAITSFTKVVRNLTAEHQRAETIFQGLLESAPDAMVIVAPDGRIMYANDQTDRMFGYRREDLIGKEIEILIPPRFRDVHEHDRASFFAHPEPRRMCIGRVMCGMRRGGTEFPIEVSLSEVHTDHGVLVSAAIRDVTEQLALQSELADARAESEVWAERDRIARDLHDHVIQRVFGVGLALQGTVARASSPDVQQRLGTAIDDLQGVVQDLRKAIFKLHDGSASTRLRQRIDEGVAQLSADLTTTVRYSGRLSEIDAALADHAEAVVKEAISNAVRHAEATSLTVTIDVADQLCIDVIDNGTGIPDNITGSGLVNLRRRAEAVGGTLTIEDTAGGGTRLRWAAPLTDGDLGPGGLGGENDQSPPIALQQTRRGSTGEGAA